jgi:hypothetical protein
MESAKKRTRSDSSRESGKGPAERQGIGHPHAILVIGPPEAVYYLNCPAGLKAMRIIQNGSGDLFIYNLGFDQFLQHLISEYSPRDPKDQKDIRGAAGMLVMFVFLFAGPCD